MAQILPERGFESLFLANMHMSISMTSGIRLILLGIFNKIMKASIYQILHLRFFGGFWAKIWAQISPKLITFQ